MFYTDPSHISPTDVTVLYPRFDFDFSQGEDGENLDASEVSVDICPFAVNWKKHPFWSLGDITNDFDNQKGMFIGSQMIQKVNKKLNRLKLIYINSGEIPFKHV